MCYQPGMSRAAPLDPDARRAQLLESARSVFARAGYHQTSVSDIISEAGVARGTFYNYFESKRAVFQAVLDDLTDAVFSSVRPFEVGLSIPDQIEANLNRLLAVLSRDRDVLRLLFADAVGLDAEADEALKAFYGAALGRLAGALSLGQDKGIVRPGDVALMARCMLGLLKEPIFQAWLRDEEVDAPRLVAELVPILTVGVMR